MIDKIFECGYFNTESIDRNKITRRITNYFEIELLLSCQGTTYIDDKPITLVPDSILLIKPGQERFNKHCKFKCCYIHCRIDTNSKYFNQMLNFPNYFRIINTEKYLEIFQSLIYYTNIKNCAFDSDIIVAKLMELIYFFDQDSKINQTYFSTAKAYINCDIHNSIQYIKKHYDENLTLSVLAEKANYSKNHYQHLFKTIMNCTPQQYILSIRLKQAKLLLHNPEIPLVDVAYQCGFSSQSYFNYIFQKELKITPLKYRKMQLANYSL